MEPLQFSGLYSVFVTFVAFVYIRKYSNVHENLRKGKLGKGKLLKCLRIVMSLETLDVIIAIYYTIQSLRII